MSEKNSKSIKPRKKLARAFLEAACILYDANERKESIQMFLKAASLGSLEAQVNLANIYDDGDGVHVNLGKARYWYKRAIRGGSSEAAYNLGISYKNKGDYRWSKYWLEKARDMGDDDAEEQIHEINAAK